LRERELLVNEKLIFLQLQKTGGTFVESRILELFPETKQLGKHYRIPREFNIEQRKVVGAIRDPWDWYLSYWSYSCLSKGGPYSRCVSNKSLFNVLKNARSANYHHEFSLGLKHFTEHIFAEITRPVDKWHYVYENADDPKRFRLWLNMVLSEERKYDLFQDFGGSQLSGCSGIYTYLFLFLFAKKFSDLFTSKLSPEKLNLIELNVDHILRVEQLDNDFNGLIKTLYGELDLHDSFQSKKEKINTSKRSHKREYYYDEQTFELVRNKEQFIINKFGYEL
jgi:hypothetical protein